MVNDERYSVQVLRDCITLQNRKGADYQSKVSDIKQAEYYLHGSWTIYDTMHAKMLRLKSVLSKAEAGEDLNFESIKDSCMDLINYASFLAAYVDGKMDGQDPTRDMFNRMRNEYKVNQV